MPGGDRTGPLGMGPMTGRAAGGCAGYGVPGYISPAWGRGCFGWGRSRGAWGFGNWYGPAGWAGWQRGLGRPMPDFADYGPDEPETTAEEEIKALKSQAKYYEDALRSTQAFIKELMEEAKQE